MDVQSLKHCICARDHSVSVLLVDVESELLPRKDSRGNWLYYCLEGHHIFSVEAVTVQTHELAARDEVHEEATSLA